ncbi:MAG: hypothetical protein ACKOYC_07380 [Bacteroidota bacterium]
MLEHNYASEEESFSENDSADSDQFSHDEEDDNNEDEYYLTCPCCDMNFTQLPPDCDDFLLEYDASFREVTGDRISCELDELKDGLLELLEQGAEPNVTDPTVEAIWNEVRSAYNPGDTKPYLIVDMLLDYIDRHVDQLGGVRFHASEQEGAPGFSSSMLYYFSSDPCQFIDRMTQDILQKLGRT